MNQVTIYGGSFNPPHLGHAAVIRTLLDHFPNYEIWLMPSGERLDKKFNVSGKHRRNMLEIMIKDLFSSDQKRIKIDVSELRLPQPTNTYQTKSILEKQYPEHKFYFVIGAELVPEIKTKWVNGEKLYHSANFIVIDNNRIALIQSLPHAIVLKINEVINISSTKIRSLIASGNFAIPQLIPKIIHYIRENNLYLDDQR